MDDSHLEGIAERIKQRRLALGMTQHEVAIRMDARAPTVTRYERGQNYPSAAALAGLATALQTTVHWIVTGEDPYAANGDDVAQADPPGWVDYAASGEAGQLTEEERLFLRDTGLAAQRAGRVPTPMTYAAWAGILRTLTTVATRR